MTEIKIPRAELEELLGQAAHSGACVALKAVGLEDPNAADDVRDLRELLISYRELRGEVKRAIRRLVIRAILIGVLGAAGYHAGGPEWFGLWGK
jgi:hypothetical protein